MRSRLVAWAAGRTRRERALLGVTASVLLAGTVGVAGAALTEHLGALRARVDGRSRQLAEVRRLAATLAASGSGATEESDGSSLVARLETTAAAVVGPERIASMTPTTEPAEDGLVAERVTLQVRNASLEEAVRLLHALEAERPRSGVTRLELRKHPDDAGRFDAAIEIARLRSAE